MADISHYIGGDLSLGPTGDLAVADGTVVGQQRVLRRLLTNPGDYIWNLSYGAGLAQFVGQPANPPAIQAVIQSQMQIEAAVAQTPAPTVTVTTDGAGAGDVFASISYADSTTGTTVVLSVPISGIT